MRRCRVESAWKAAIVMMVLLAARQVDAADGTWNVGSGGNWSDAGNWASSTVADGTDSTATFPNIITAHTNINLDVDRTIGNIVYEDTGQHLTITNNTLTLDVTSGSPEINVVDEEVVIRSVVAGNDGLTKTGVGTLALRETNTFTGKTVVLGGVISVDDLALEGEASPLGAPTGADATIDLYPGTFFYFQPPDIRSVYFTTDRTINMAGSGSGTVKIQSYYNDKWCSFAAITGTGTGPRTLSLHVGGGGQGDRNRMRITGPITDTSDDVVSLLVTFTAQAAGAGRLILEATNTFSGPITINSNNKINPYQMIIGGAGTLGSGSYSNIIATGVNMVFDYASSALQTISGEISGPGTLQTSGTGVLTLTAPSNSLANLSLANNGTLRIGDGTAGSILTVTNNINVPNGATTTLALDLTGGEILVDVVGSMVYAGSHNSYLKIIGDSQATPIISYGGSVTNFDYVIYNDVTNTWAEATAPRALDGKHIRVQGTDIYIDSVIPEGVVFCIY